MNEIIRLEKISYGYRKSDFHIQELSLNFFCGETVVLTGHNGSGKTTLSKLMIGILKPEKGDVFIDKVNIKKSTLAQNAKKVGYLFQNPERQLFCSSVREEILFSLRQTGLKDDEADLKMEELLDKFNMGGIKDSYPLKLSGGEKQRLALLTIFAMQPRYYILDEPSKGLDKNNRQILMQILREIKGQGMGFCIVTHDKELVECLADRRIVMEKGRVLTDEKT